MPYQTDPEGLGALLPGEPPYRIDQLREWLYLHPVLEPAMMTNLPASVRDGLADRLWPFRVEAERVTDDGRTIKWLFRTPDGSAIEAVLMGYPRPRRPTKPGAPWRAPSAPPATASTGT
jgi:23S rRNA (adenine2503-C2)-methyltransferase